MALYGGEREGKVSKNCVLRHGNILCGGTRERIKI
jgi:hypothetical protein